MSYNLTLKQKLGIIIGNRRKEYHITQKEMTKKLNYTQSMISRIELGIEIINLDVYKQALNVFNLDYTIDETIDIEIEQFIDTIYHSFLKLDATHLRNQKEQYHHLKSRNKNVLSYFNLFPIELAICYLEQDFDNFKRILDEIKNYVKVFTQKSRELYKLVTIHYHLEVLHLDEMDSIGSIDSTGITDYLLGISYYNEFNHSKALHHFMSASEAFLITKNYSRFAQSQIYINKMLLKENDYSNVLININHVLNEHQHQLNISDLHQLNYLKAYCLYHIKNYQESYELLNQIKNSFTGNNKCYLNYLFDKVCLKLNNETLFANHKIDEPNVLYFLYNSYKSQTKTDRYYQTIEQQIIDDIDYHFDKIEYQAYTMDLLTYYWDKRQLKKYKNLITKVNRIINNR